MFSLGESFEKNGISRIGEFLEKGEKTFLAEGGAEHTLQPSARDELTKLFE